MIAAAVLGMGRVGRARQRCIGSQSGLRLAACLSRRAEDFPKQWQSFLTDPQIEALFVCTENDAHQPWMSQALHHGKHVCVDFPLCLDPKEAEQLLALAHQNNRVLHCEFIGLLTRKHLARKQDCAHRRLQKLECRFTGGLSGWVLREHHHHRWGQLAVGRLQALWDLAGALTPEEIRFEGEEKQYLLEVRMRSSQGAEVLLTEERCEGLGRTSSHTAIFEDGNAFTESTACGPQFLFDQDTAIFLRRVKEAQSGYVSDQAITAVLRLAALISAHCSKQ